MQELSPSDSGLPPASSTDGESKAHPASSEFNPKGTPALHTEVTTLQTVIMLEKFHVWSPKKTVISTTVIQKVLYFTYSFIAWMNLQY